MPAATTMPAPGETAMPGEAAMPAFAGMPGEAGVPMRKAVAPPAMVEVVVVMTPATEPAIDVDVRAVGNGPVTNGLGAR